MAEMPANEARSMTWAFWDMKQVCPDAGVLVERQGEAQKTSKRVHKMFSKILGQNTW